MFKHTVYVVNNMPVAINDAYTDSFTVDDFGNDSNTYTVEDEAWGEFYLFTESGDDLSCSDPQCYAKTVFASGNEHVDL